ncbi:MAG: trehalase family glycosidase [Candidatus Helarchaeota archaeon]
MIIITPNKNIDRTSKFISNYWDELINIPHHSHKNCKISHPYITPSKRFNALFYWDTYFQNLGLLIDDKYDLAKGCVENFIEEINYLGFIPNFNGPKRYSKSRSQPPFLCSMIHDLFCVSNDKELLKKSIKPLVKEYNYWTSNSKLYKFGLSRYFDTSIISKLQPFSTIAESGWDITNRFKNVKKSIPIDLNTLLYIYEREIPHFMEIIGLIDNHKILKWNNLMKVRLEKIMNYMWDDIRQFFYDYSVATNSVERSSSLAGFFPLWAEMINNQIAQLCVKKVKHFLKPGGFVTTLDNEMEGIWKVIKLLGLQWCYPVGWAPLQWIVNKGLCNYGYDKIAAEASLQFIKMVSDIFIEKHAIFEKYNVVEKSINVKATYKMHTGFGWTNGVFQALLTRIILGLEPSFQDSIIFSPRIPVSWKNKYFKIKLKNFPKLGLEICIEKDGNNEPNGIVNIVKYIVYLNKPINIKLQFYTDVNKEFQSIILNSEEIIQKFNIEKVENSLEQKVLAKSNKNILFKKGKNVIKLQY